MIEKVLREANRLRLQITSLPKWAANLIFTSPNTDLALTQKSKATKGRLKNTGKIAIYLIFPINGLNQYHKRTLDELQRNNYSPIIISNARLQESDLNFLENNSQLIIERENLGYDFGGYREGILASSSILKSCRKLLMLNDSTIFPLQKNSTWIQRAEQSGFDFTGSICMNGHKKPKHIRARLPKPECMNTKSRKFHYPSFAIMLDASIAQGEALQHFFGNLKPSNLKKEVVKRGEIGLSKWAIKQGYSHGSLLSRQEIFTTITTLSSEELLGEIKMAITPQSAERKDQFTKDIQSLAMGFKADCEDWRSEAIQALCNLSLRYHPAYTLAHLLCTRCEFPFLKKAIQSKGSQGELVYNKIMGTSIVLCRQNINALE
jgi:hypothetical protein